MANFTPHFDLFAEKDYLIVGSHQPSRFLQKNLDLSLKKFHPKFSHNFPPMEDACNYIQASSQSPGSKTT